MSRTPFLVAIAVAAILIQFFPSQTGNIKWAAIALVVIYLSLRVLRTYPRQYKEKKLKAAQLAADSEEYHQYQLHLEALRKKYDLGLPDPEATAAAAEPPLAYQQELTALNDSHRNMLTRKFGSY